MPQHRELTDLSDAECREIVRQIQSILWFDYSGQEQTFIWNPDKEWDCETIEYVSGVLEDAGLKPADPIPSPANQPD
jgi:hypothetical protein